MNLKNKTVAECGGSVTAVKLPDGRVIIPQMPFGGYFKSLPEALEYFVKVCETGGDTEMREN